MRITPRLKRVIWIKTCIKLAFLVMALVGDAQASPAADCSGRADSGQAIDRLTLAMHEVRTSWESDGAPMDRWLTAAKACRSVDQYSFVLHVVSERPVRREHAFRTGVHTRRFFIRAYIGPDGFPRFSERRLHSGVRLLFNRFQADRRTQDNTLTVRAHSYESKGGSELPAGGHACARAMAELFADVIKSSGERLRPESQFGGNRGSEHR